MPGNRISPFIRLDGRSHEYSQGYRAALKACAAWLHEEAEMRGRHARGNLRRAAQEMSREAKAIIAGANMEEQTRAEMTEAFSTTLGEVWADDPKVLNLVESLRSARQREERPPSSPPPASLG